MNCLEMQEILPAYARDSERSLEAKRHLSRCEDCRAELRRYETILWGLSELKAQPADEVPAGLLASLLDIPNRESTIDVVKAHVARNRKVYAGAAAAVVGVAGAAVGAAALRKGRRKSRWAIA
jgi:anti-sigma factor RsiW